MDDREGESCAYRETCAYRGEHASLLSNPPVWVPTMQGLTSAQVPSSCPPPAMFLAQRVSDWLKQLKDAGHLEMNSISTASQLRTASGFR